jgi:hypothetical protein
MIYNIAIDADSIAYKACYRHMNEDKTETNMELAYMEFCGEIQKICDNVFIQKDSMGNTFKGLFEYEKGDVVEPLIVISPSKSFRNEISPSGVMFGIKKDGSPKDLGYKANRDPDKWSVPGIKALKKMVLKRLGDIGKIVYLDNLRGSPQGKPEADDVVNYYAREFNYMVAAIDKDVINANPTYTFDYNNRKWELPRSLEQVEQWYLMQTLMGDATDNVQGAKGIGAKTAQNIIYGEFDGMATFDDIIQYFDSEMDAYINHTLVRMDCWNGKEIIPWR